MKSTLRIVSLAPSATSIVCALGAKKSLVGVTRWCRDVAPVDGLPALGDCWRCDPDKVAALKPDLLLGSIPYKAETVDALLRRGLTFLAMTPRSLADISSDILLLGRLLGRERRAHALVRDMEKRMQRIAARARRARFGRARRKPRVYIEIWSNPFIVAPRWVEEMVALAGGRFVPVPESDAARMVDESDVLSARPEIIILAWAACGMRVNAKKVLQRPNWSQLPALRRRQVFIVSDENLNTPGPPVIAGLERLARIIHPELFGPPEDEKVRQVA